MGETANLAGNYRIEVSGWGFDSNFFVEQTDLFWDHSGEKRVLLHHILADGAIVFIRLLLPESLNNTLPVACQVAGVLPMNRNGQCEVLLRQLHPRSKVPETAQRASYSVDDIQSKCGPKECSAQLEKEEVLQ
jgi:hypothetical protein